MDLAKRLQVFFQDARKIKQLGEDLAMVNLLGKLTMEDADRLAMLCLLIDNLEIPDIDLVFEDVNPFESPSMGEA
jgi:hypothetical protein|tara:strand:+ start:732 stop:956 length:225 start_codon:yes stop_codon:yes gene_type:complete